MSQSREDNDDPEAVVHPGSLAAMSGAGLVSRSSLSTHTLPEGTRLREYEVVGLVGEGGFGIVYLAYDHSLQRHVAVKEYMPASIATRGHASSQVVVKSERHQSTFQVGLKSFVNEARLLARFDNPSLVKVYRFWEQNGTAYMAMPYYEGPTLTRALAHLGRAASEAELRGWLRPLLDALTAMHAARCYHRDIAPDNILLTRAGPLLLDFGAARRVIGDMTHALTVVLKPGYAPIEQYGEVASMAQGAWTDLYALASVVHFAITGRPPMSSVERLMADQLVPLSVRMAGRYSAPFLHAIDTALAVKPHDRPQSVAEFRDLLDGRSSASIAADGFAATLPGGFEDDTAVAPPTTWTPPTLPPPLLTQPIDGLSALITSPPSTTAPAARLETPPGPLPEPMTLMPAELDAAPATMPAAARPRGRWVAAATVACISLAASGAYLMLRGADTPAPSSMARAATEPATSTVSSGAPVSAETPPAVDVAPQITISPAPAPATPDRSADLSAAIVPATAEPHAGRPVPARPATVRPSAPARSAEVSAQCSDILQKASLEPLTAAEAQFMRKECR